MKFEMGVIEKRLLPVQNEDIEFRAGEGTDDNVVAGYGIVYGRETEIWPGFKEVIREGAFSEALKSKREIKSFFNHDPGQVLSTTRSKPELELEETKKGVRFVSPIPPTSYGEDLKVNLERKNVRGSSFTFTVTEDDWREDKKGNLTREVIRGDLYEIGPVTNPAYKQSSALLRSTEELVEERKAFNIKNQEREEKERQAEIAKNDLDLKLKTVEALEKL